MLGKQEVNLDIFGGESKSGEIYKPSTSDRLIFAMAGISRKIDNYRQAVTRLLDEGAHIAFGYSGGKDSGVTLTLGLDVIASYKKRGGTVPKFVVLHGNTKVEMPEVHKLALDELDKVSQFLVDNDLVEEGSIHIAEPNITADYLVGIIGGRAIGIMPDNGHAKCSDDLKIQPMTTLKNKVFKTLVKETGARVVTLIGTRTDESVSRGKAMSERGESNIAPVQDKNGYWVLSPISDFTLEDIFLIFDEAKTGRLNAYSDLQSTLALYGDAAEPGSCSLAAFAGTDTKSTCGGDGTQARFGCFLCLRVSRDSSLENISTSAPKYAYLAPLNVFRNYIQDAHYIPSKRNWLSRTVHNDGTVHIAPNSYSPMHVEDLLRFALTIDMNEQAAAEKDGVAPRFQLITQERLIAIENQWMRYSYHHGFEACRIWLDVVNNGSRYEIPQLDVTHTKLPNVQSVKVPFADSEYGDAFSGYRDLAMATADTENVSSKSAEKDNEYIAKHGGGTEGYLEYLGQREFGGNDTYANYLRRANGQKEFTPKIVEARNFIVTETAEKLTIDAEGLEDFFNFPELGIGYCVDKYSPENNMHLFPSAGMYELLRYGFLAIRSGSHAEQDRMVRMGNQISRHGIRDILNDPEALVLALRDLEPVELPKELQTIEKTVEDKVDQMQLFFAA